MSHPSSFNKDKLYKTVPPMKCCKGKHEQVKKPSMEELNKIIEKQEHRNNKYPSANQRRAFMKF